MNSCIRTSSGTVTGYFTCNIGTRQGDISSPKLFSLLIDQLSSVLREQCNSGMFIDNSIPDIGCLMFADDIEKC